jgi:UDP-sugar transporter A1/2/3
MSCRFCGASAEGHGLPRTRQSAQRVLQATLEEQLEEQRGEPAQQPGSSPVAAAPQQRPQAALGAAWPPHEPHEHVSRKAKGGPRLSQPSSAPSSTAFPASSVYIVGALVTLAVAGACLVCACQKRKGFEGSRLLSAAAELEEGSAALPVSSEEAAAVRRRFLCVLFLCLQYSAYALLRRYATGILHEQWTAQSVLGFGELLKFAISLGMIASSPAHTEAPGELPLTGRLHWLLVNSGKMAVPALMYLFMNMLGFVSLNRIDAGTFAVIQQSKIFFTALFQWVFFGRTLSQAKMCALFTLVLGVLLISLEARPSHTACTSGAGETPSSAVEQQGFAGYILGVVAVTLDCLLSGLATVYFEKVLKTTTLTVWDRNVQLAFYSMLIYIPWSVYDHPADPLHGWSRNTVVVALLGAVGGILVALVIKYADGLAKNISTASSIVITAAASHYLFDGPMNHAIVIGSMVVVASGYNYQNVQ